MTKARIRRILAALFGVAISFGHVFAQDKLELGAVKSIAARSATLNYESEIEKLEDEFAKRRAELREKYMRDLDEARKQSLEKADLDEAQRILALKDSVENQADTESTQRKRRDSRGGLTILHAFFGTGPSWADVTTPVKKHAKASKLVLEVPYHGHELARLGFPDPAPNRIKRLVIVYSMNGQVGVAVAETSRSLELPVTDHER